VHPHVTFKIRAVTTFEMAENKYYFEEKIVLAWARLNVPGSIAHATMVLHGVNSEGLFDKA
jgi:hypothetical protein